MNKGLIAGILFLVIFPCHAGKGKLCTGNFVNPITDVCWDCIFPLSIGNVKEGRSKGNPDTPNPSLPIQLCNTGNIPRPGVAIGYWEPSYLVDVTTQ